MKLVKNRDKSINKTSVSSISTDWSIQSISIKSDLPIFIDLSIVKSIPIFIDWLLWVLMDGPTNWAQVTYGADLGKPIVPIV